MYMVCFKKNIVMKFYWLHLLLLQTQKETVKWLSVRYSVPEWLVEKISKDYGKLFDGLLMERLKILKLATK